ncbi:glycosyltransferase 87 family protein [Streptomyces sp. NPDC057743]|uniref:glycosyltransferase 87 family protein n=1 Tax=Streptomyces sp. NPDC057743 TaxID=3346236 RepID=UPI0036C28EA1
MASPGRLGIGVALLALSFAGLYALSLAVQLPMSDIEVYRAEGHAAATGGDLYGFTVTKWALPATYPPFAALLFVPTTWISLTTLKITCVLVNAALLALLIHLSCKAAGLRRAAYSAPLVLATTAVGLWLEPVFQTLVFGQVNLALTCLVLWDLSRPDGARFKGFATGLAAGIKLTPAIFAVYLLITGRVKAAFTTFAGFVASVLLGALVLPGATVEFWTQRMFETQRVGKVWIVDNQSLQGLVARLLHTAEPGGWWLAAAAITAVAGLWAARQVYVRRGHDLWGVLATAVTALLVSPISWSHHWVWCVPLLVALVAHARRDRWRWALVGAVAVAFSARTMWAQYHRGTVALHFSWWQQPLAAPYPMLGLALLAALTWWAYRTPPRAGGPGGIAAGRRVPFPRTSGRSPAASPLG